MSKINFVIIFLFLTFFLYSQKSKDEPSWIYLKKAENLKSQMDYATALTMARKAKQVRIQEKLDIYRDDVFKKQRDKTEYEIKKMVAQKREQLIENDDYPEYHELMGDLYYLTGFLSESIKEYKTTILQKNSFEYPQKLVEVKYKLANVYEKVFDYELSDIIYREITEMFFKKRKQDFWNRIQLNIKDDPTLEKVMRIYRVDGIEYLKALYKVGKRSALIGRDK
ncbi:MAG TPA: hypothetical protein PK771_03065 [Spirochaetota bacterium]|nr:hypothetical protein [Spirochaetota bacterium]